LGKQQETYFRSKVGIQALTSKKYKYLKINNLIKNENDLEIKKSLLMGIF